VDLEKFELSVGSYFKQFTKAVVYVRDAGEGKPGFVDTPKEQGGAQLFPRGEDVLPMIQDGRWKHPPYPNNWTFRHARMVFGKNITDGQALQSYQEYLKGLKH
jgi:hypothetical protein